MTDDVRMQVLSNGIISKCSSRSTRPIFRDIASFVIVFRKRFKICISISVDDTGSFLYVADKGIKSDGRQRVRHGRLEISAGNWPLREWVICCATRNIRIYWIIYLHASLAEENSNYNAIVMLFHALLYFFIIKMEMEICVLYGKLNKTQPSPIANM